MRFCDQIAAVGIYGARKVVAFAKAMLKARKENAEGGGEGDSAVATTSDDDKEEGEEEKEEVGNVATRHAFTLMVLSHVEFEVQKTAHGFVFHLVYLFLIYF